MVLPVPYDSATSYGAGARKGPLAIIESSIQLELYDDELDLESYLLGIHTLPFLEPLVEPEKMHDSIRSCVSNIIKDKKIPIIIGGDHSISFGPIKALYDSGEEFTVIHFDAHTDLRDSYQGSKFSHACVMRRVADLNIPITQIGIRSLSKEDADYLKSSKLINTFFARDLYKNNDFAGIAESIKTKKIYITFDVDAFDPSIISSTGTPEPGGLTWYQTLSIIKTLTDRFDVIGFDVVELAPNTSSPSEFIVSKLIYKIIGYITQKRRTESGC
ncbi:MAG: agmatinase [bacterium]